MNVSKAELVADLIKVAEQHLFEFIDNITAESIRQGVVQVFENYKQLGLVGYYATSTKIENYEIVVKLTWLDNEERQYIRHIIFGKEEIIWTKIRDGENV